MRGRNWFAFSAYFCYALCTALCTRYFLREGKDALWAEIRWI